MKHESLIKMYRPQEGGWERLHKKMNHSEEMSQQELVLWKNMVAALLIGFLMMPIIKFMLSPSLDLNYIEPQGEELLLAEGQAVKVPHSVSGVRFYWIFIDQAQAQYKDGKK